MTTIASNSMAFLHRFKSLNTNHHISNLTVPYDTHVVQCCASVIVLLYLKTSRRLHALFTCLPPTNSYNPHGLYSKLYTVSRPVPVPTCQFKDVCIPLCHRATPRVLKAQVHSTSQRSRSATTSHQRWVGLP